jgi:hypothetical protein
MLKVQRYRPILEASVLELRLAELFSEKGLDRNRPTGERGPDVSRRLFREWIVVQDSSEAGAILEELRYQRRSPLLM